METNPFLGVLYHWIGGLSAASTFLPFRRIQRWSFEIFWLVQGVAAWIVTPYLVAWLLVPELGSILSAAPRTAMSHTLLYGIAWGVGGLTFGLAVRYLGIALGYAIALGFSTVFGTLIPPILSGQLGGIASQRGGQIILLGIGVCVLAIAVNGLAGYYKDREMTAAELSTLGERDYSFGKGILVAVFSGIMSAFFAFGLASGKPIAEVAKVQLLLHGKANLWQNLPVLVVVLWGGFATNLVWCAVLITRNRSVMQFLGEPGINPMSAESGNAIYESVPGSRIGAASLMKNYLFAALGGVIWYFQFFFYSMGQTKMGRYDFSSWTLHMASIILFAAIWGLVLHEWRGTSLRTRTVLSFGLILLMGSTVVIGYGNYISAH